MSPPEFTLQLIFPPESAIITKEALKKSAGDGGDFLSDSRRRIPK